MGNGFQCRTSRGVGGSFLTLLILVVAGTAHARTETFSWWDPNPLPSPVVGFRLHLGSSSGNYSTVLDVGLPTPDANGVYSASTQVSDAAVVYVTMTAYDIENRQSFFSNEQVRRPNGDSGRAPTAMPDAYAVDRDAPLVVYPDTGLLANDSDPDSDALTAVLVTDVTSGNLFLNSNGAFWYTPAPGYVGTDAFTYHAADGEMPSNLATVTITVSSDANGSPESRIDAPTGPLTITAGDAVFFAGSGTDPDGDLPLGYSWDFGDPAIPASSAKDPGSVVFSQVGSFDVLFAVTDSRGATDPTPAGVTIVVEAPPDSTGSDPVPDWPDHYDPFDVLTYNLVMTEANWNTIRRDLSFDIEVPSLLWANSEAPVLVSARRKSSSAFPDESDPQKFALKIDVNEYAEQDAAANVVCREDHGFVAPACVENWHGMKKLSLESGDDNNVVTEGIAWYLRRLASETLGFTSGLAAWVELYVTLTDRTDAQGRPIADRTFYNGVFVNVEQHDKQFLKNHGMWDGGDQTWLTKVSEPYDPEIREAPVDASGDPLRSPAETALDFPPFQECRPGGPSSACDEQPSGAAFRDVLDTYVDMEGLLALGAVSAFHVSPDDLFSKGKNFFFVDYADTALGRREYLQWDLDAAFAGLDTAADIYTQGDGTFGDYSDEILDEPVFRDRYSQTMQTLLDGPFSATDLAAALTGFETLLTDALDADSHNNLSDGTASEFAFMRGWLADRVVHVQAQLSGSPPTSSGPSIHLGDLTGSSARNRRNRWDATARVDVHDSGHAAVDGATISGAWDTGGAGSCVTVAGSCDLTLERMRLSRASATFTVLDITPPEGVYEPAANDVSSSVAIDRP